VSRGLPGANADVLAGGMSRAVYKEHARFTISSAASQRWPLYTRSGDLDFIRKDFGNERARPSFSPHNSLRAEGTDPGFDGATAEKGHRHVTDKGDIMGWDCDYDSIDDCQPTIVNGGGGWCAINPTWHPDPSQSESAPAADTIPAQAVPIPRPRPLNSR
jgi:hypothetical protein